MTIPDLSKMRHTLAHILMQALIRLYKDPKPGVGPSLDDGFYHDFVSSHKVTDADFPAIEAMMKKIIAEDLEVKGEKLPVEAGIQKLESMGYTYTKELAYDLKQQGEKEISFYSQGEFTNMCKGNHVEATGQVGAFKLVKIAGAYWKGDEKNPMMQRIYGYAFETEKELAEYMAMQEEAKKRDHRKLGKELDLFVSSDLVGKGLPLLTENGATIRREIERFIVDEEIKRGYVHVTTPELASVDLYRKSGHYPYYKDSMYPPMVVDGEELILRPMTCPHHYQLFLSRPRSYRELPMRIAEIARLYRYEKSGELTGLIRLRSFSLADSHIICRKEQAKEEIMKVLDLIEYVASVFGLQKGKNYSYRLSLGDRKDEKKYYKNDASWDEAEVVLRSILDERKSPYVSAQDEAAFYGPKIDIQMKNVNGKEDTAFTVQYDFCMPARFEMTYTNEKGQDEAPVVIHRSSVGSIERTIAFLIEHFAGAFPVWLAPIQVALIPVGEAHHAFAHVLKRRMMSQGIRVRVEDGNTPLGKRIREMSLYKIPYQLVIGDKEMNENIFSVRRRGKEDLERMSFEEFAKKIDQEIREKTL